LSAKYLTFNKLKLLYFNVLICCTYLIEVALYKINICINYTTKDKIKICIDCNFIIMIRV